MLRHIVCFRFHPDTPAEGVVALQQGLERLPGLIPQIADYRVGPDLGLNATSWDLGLTADFASVADYESYRDHPDHQALIRDLVDPITAQRVSVQYRL